MKKATHILLCKTGIGTQSRTLKLIKFRIDQPNVASVTYIQIIRLRKRIIFVSYEIERSMILLKIFHLFSNQPILKFFSRTDGKLFNGIIFHSIRYEARIHLSMGVH